MEWWVILILFFVLLILFIFSGFPVAFAFFTVNIIITTIVISFDAGMSNLIYSAFQSVSQFSLTPIPLFVLMGAFLFHSGLVMKVLDVFSSLLGRVPSRLSLLAVGTGTIFSALNGSVVANAAMLGSVLTPEMSKRGYHNKMIIGPILAAGSLAMIIPPSAMAILLGSLGKISVGDLLIAGIIPGILISVALIVYYLALGIINPSLAPAYHVEQQNTASKIVSFIKYVVPMGLLIVLVLGLIFTGYATPTESSAVGALAAIILVISYGRINKEVISKSVIETIKTSGMVLLIMASSAGFSQLLAYTGATKGLVDFALTMDMLPIMTIIIMLIIVLILGTFIEPISIMMITIPLYIPVVTALEYDLVWFGILMLVCLGLGNITPPFGILLFVMKGVSPASISMKAIYKSVIGIIIIQILCVILMIIFPQIVTWLPSLE